MNKLKVTIAGLLVACLGIGVMNAQDNMTTTPAAKKTTPKAKTAGTSKTLATTPAKTSATGQHLKKDGTPDKRYKENKTAKPAGAGTPATKSTTSTAKKKTGSKTTSTPAAKTPAKVKPHSNTNTN
jgi:hypothetical protein